MQLQGEKTANEKYIAGRKFEYEIIRYFEEKGYYTIRSAGSKGLADIVAISYNNRPCDMPIIIQAKKYKDTKPKPEQEFIDFDINATKIWCTKRRGQHGFDIEYV